MFIELELNKLNKSLKETIEKLKFGKIENEKILLNYFEIYFLVESNKFSFERIIKKEILEKIKLFIQSNFDKYLVFKDLINKNFVVKSGLKYGAHFRIYLKKDFENKEHSKYLVYVLNAKELIKSEEIISLFRIAHSVKKRVIFAFIDEEGSIVYYENKWLRI